MLRCVTFRTAIWPTSPADLGAAGRRQPTERPARASRNDPRRRPCARLSCAASKPSFAAAAKRSSPQRH